MSTWLLVWFVVGIVTTVAMVGFLVALARHALLLGRTARRMQEEVAPLTQQITADVDRAGRRTSTLRR